VHICSKHSAEMESENISLKAFISVAYCKVQKFKLHTGVSNRAAGQNSAMTQMKGLGQES